MALASAIFAELAPFSISCPSSPSSSIASSATASDDDADPFVPVFLADCPFGSPYSLDRSRPFLHLAGSDLFPEPIAAPASASDSLGLAAEPDVHADADLAADELGAVAGLPIRWDCLQIADESEWEQVDGADRADQVRVSDYDTAGWELLLTLEGAASGIDGVWQSSAAEEVEVEIEVVDDNEDFDYTSDHEVYEVLASQLAEQNFFPYVRPPAAISAVNALPCVVLGEAAVDRQCAVCKDDMAVGDRVVELPCGHGYHDCCILPWFRVCNSCPLCRYELPTDDPEYESWKARQAAIGGLQSS